MAHGICTDTRAGVNWIKGLVGVRVVRTCQRDQLSQLTSLPKSSPSPHTGRNWSNLIHGGNFILGVTSVVLRVVGACPGWRMATTRALSRDGSSQYPLWFAAKSLASVLVRVYIHAYINKTKTIYYIAHLLAASQMQLLKLHNVCLNPFLWKSEGGGEEAITNNLTMIKWNT